MVTDSQGNEINAFIARKMRLLKRLPHTIEEEGIDQRMVAYIQDIIATSAPEWTRENKDRIGRIESSDMHDLVKSRVTSENENHATYLIGWDPQDFADKRTPSYPVIQDQGVKANPRGALSEADNNVPGAERIPAMHALQTTRDEFIPIIRAAMRAKLRGREGDS